MNARLLTLLLFIFLSGCGGGSSSSGGAGDKEDLILALGDSIGSGYATGGYAFPELVSIQMAIPVVNDSRPGISAEEGVLGAEELIAQHNPRYIIALLGTNNALGAAGEADGAVSALEYLANICDENGIICIIGTLPPITLASSLNGNAQKISAGIRTIAGVRIAENGDMTGSDIGSDGIHPNGGGQNKIAAAFISQF